MVARGGVVTLIQRFGCAVNLNLNVRPHMLVLDGVYEPIGERVRFRCVRAPSDAQIKDLPTRMIARILRHLLSCLRQDDWFTEDAEQLRPAALARRAPVRVPSRCPLRYPFPAVSQFCQSAIERIPTSAQTMRASSVRASIRKRYTAAVMWVFSVSS